MQQYRTIPIHVAAPWHDEPPPQLDGEPALLRELMSALEHAVCAELGAVVPVGAWLRELRIDTEQAVLALAPGLARPELLQVTFETLRARLHDTDIYVGAARH